MIINLADHNIAILGRGKSSSGRLTRKERRKAERNDKKAQRHEGPPAKRTKLQNDSSTGRDYYESPRAELERPAAPTKPAKAPKAKEAAPKPKSILKKTKPVEERSPSPEPSNKPSKAVLDKLADDDAKIAFLEKKLGIKSKNSRSQSFQDDGLEELLAGLDGDSDGSVQEKKRKRSEGDEWLAEKRRKAMKDKTGGNDFPNEDDEDDEDESAGSEMSLDGEEYPDDEEDDFSGLDGEEDILSTGENDEEDDNEDDYDEEADEGEDFEGLDSDEESEVPAPRVRENPYVAPVAKGESAPAKYIPPSLRKPSSSDSEALVRLRRQTQGLVNRLTEANLISILGDIEKLYRDNARQHVTSTLVDLLLISVCEPTSLPDTLIILPAGFISAVYKIIGTDFGAQVIQRIVELFDGHYSHATAAGNSGPNAATSDSSKETSNLITLLSQLYNFQVVGSNLMFDYIRLFLETLSELNAELLLKIIRTSGPQLRQDDPSSLKDIVNMLRPAVAKVGEANISVRMKFMIETINDLKNNKMKTGAAASAVVSEHTVRMKKTIGSLNTRSIKGSEPLRIGLKDIKESDKKGKWWLVGASWAGNDIEPAEETETASLKSTNGTTTRTVVVDDGSADLVQLAREQRMNTDIRRAIFITVMSSTDFQDAHLRLLKLKLKRVQELEIPKVLIHCSAAETAYNPYYTLIAKKLCGDKRLRMAFQFSLWDLFKRMGESDDEGAEVEEEGEDAMGTRELVNLAKMFGTLIAEGGLTLSVLKNLNMSYLQPKTKTFVEVLFITIFLHSQRQAEDKRDEQAVVNIVLKAKDAPQLVRGLLYFVKKVVSKTDIAGGKAEKATVKWASKLSADILAALTVDVTA
jgi:nucleolar MIF4G domain-containing protein 1